MMGLKGIIKACRPKSLSASTPSAAESPWSSCVRWAGSSSLAIATMSCVKDGSLRRRNVWLMNVDLESRFARAGFCSGFAAEIFPTQITEHLLTAAKIRLIDPPPLPI